MTCDTRIGLLIKQGYPLRSMPDNNVNMEKKGGCKIVHLMLSLRTSNLIYTKI